MTVIVDVAHTEVCLCLLLEITKSLQSRQAFRQERKREGFHCFGPIPLRSLYMSALLCEIGMGAEVCAHLLISSAKKLICFSFILLLYSSFMLSLLVSPSTLELSA